jgi:hypothetical protein
MAILLWHIMKCDTVVACIVDFTKGEDGHEGYTVRGLLANHRAAYGPECSLSRSLTTGVASAGCLLTFCYVILNICTPLSLQSALHILPWVMFWPCSHLII